MTLEQQDKHDDIKAWQAVKAVPISEIGDPEKVVVLMDKTASGK